MVVVVLVAFLSSAVINHATEVGIMMVLVVEVVIDGLALKLVVWRLEKSRKWQK